MFRPAGRPVAHSRPALPAQWRTFQLVGLVHARNAQALVQLQDPVEMLWVRKGDRVAGLEVLDVESESLLLRVGEGQSRLKVGQSSLPLGAQRVFSEHCRVLGVSTAGGRAYALALFEGHKDPVQLTLGDQVPGGRITRIDPEGVWVSREGAARLVGVGQTTQTLDRSDSPGGSRP